MSDEKFIIKFRQVKIPRAHTLISLHVNSGKILIGVPVCKKQMERNQEEVQEFPFKLSFYFRYVDDDVLAIPIR